MLELVIFLDCKQLRKVNNDIHGMKKKRAANALKQALKTCALSWHSLQGVKALN